MEHYLFSLNGDDTVTERLHDAELVVTMSMLWTHPIYSGMRRNSSRLVYVPRA